MFDGKLKIHGTDILSAIPENFDFDCGNASINSRKTYQTGYHESVNYVMLITEASKRLEAYFFAFFSIIFTFILY